MYHYASLCDINSIRRMLAQGTGINDRDQYGRTALHGALPGSTVLTQFLVDMNADINASCRRGSTPLHSSFVPSNARILIEANADLNALDYRMNTPLHTCCTIYNSDHNYLCAQVLVEAGCRTDLCNLDGRTALEKAIGIRRLYEYLALYSRDNIAQTLMLCMSDDVPLELIRLIADFVTSI